MAYIVKTLKIRSVSHSLLTSSARSVSTPILDAFGMRKRFVIVAVVLGTITILISGWSAYSKWKYPCGWSHCCIILMVNAMEQYAEEHGGRYPAGESSPEASLSLLCRSNCLDPGTIRGMTVPERTVRRILEGGGLLGPDSCGWQYLDGLTQADDPRLALLYCKQALGHNGQRTKDGGRQVVVCRERWYTVDFRR
jgi:hypothetical protein